MPVPNCKGQRRSYDEKKQGCIRNSIFPYYIAGEKHYVTDNTVKNDMIKKLTKYVFTLL